MRRIVWIVAAAASAVGMAGRRADAGCSTVKTTVKTPIVKATLTLAPAPPKKAGQVVTVTDDQTVEGHVDQGGASTPLAQKVRQAYTVTIVAADGGVVTEARHHAIGTNDKTADELGAQYDLAPLGETCALRDTEPDRLVTLIASRTFVKDEPIALTADERTDVLSGPTQRATATAATLTWLAADAKTATFALAGTYAGKRGAVDLTVAFTITIEVDRKRSRPTDLALIGAIAGGAADDRTSLIGTVRGHCTIAY